jgi:hypothetical protein
MSRLSPSLRWGFLAIVGLLGFLWAGGEARAACHLPYQLNQGTITDAVKVMADLNALVACAGTTTTAGSCSPTAPGLVPATGGGTTKFLRADCIFAAIEPGAVSPCSTTAAGLVPATGGGTEKFLRADCIFAAPVPGAGGPFDIAQFMPGVPVAGISAVKGIIRIAIDRTVSCPSAFVGSTFIATDASTGSVTVSVNRVRAGVAVTFGFFTFASSATGVATSGSGMSLAAGDIVEFLYPNPADATLANIAGTLKCTRT